mmetsp:Transcript_16776/g.36392  ORF Transcript_16776/g.36392 Transcript_16776/m.36392 type:complete len:100 (+) Transcript_16776:1290-1589(+)
MFLRTSLMRSVMNSSILFVFSGALHSTNSLPKICDSDIEKVSESRHDEQSRKTSRSRQFVTVSRQAKENLVLGEMRCRLDDRRARGDIKYRCENDFRST